MKKFICAVFTVLQCFSISTNVLAVSNGAFSNQGRNMDADIVELLPFISAIASDAENLGYKNGDFDSLSVGLPIYAYEYLSTGTLRETDFVFYPVFSDDEILFMMLKKDNGLIQMTQAFCDLASDCLNEDVLIIYDINNSYIVGRSAYELRIAYTYDDPSYERGDLLGMPKDLLSEHIEWTRLSGNKEIVLESGVQPCYDPIMPPVSLAVPEVLQYFDQLCWAASTASIGNFLTGKNYTAPEVATEKYGVDFNKGGSLEDSTDMLLRMYGVAYSNFSDNTTSCDRTIYNNISAGYPMFGAWLCSSGVYHQTVIRGINRPIGIYIMDPLQGFVTAQKLTDGYSYVGVSGYTFTLKGYAFREDS